MFDLFLGLRQDIEGESQNEEEIMGSQPTFGPLLVFWEYVMGKGCWTIGLPMLRPTFVMYK